MNLILSYPELVSHVSSHARRYLGLRGVRNASKVTVCLECLQPYNGRLNISTNDEHLTQLSEMAAAETLKQLLQTTGKPK